MAFRRNIVAGNWKMNLCLDEALQLVGSIVANISKESHTEVVICPSFPLLGPISTHLKNFNRIRLGAQNCSEHQKGAYTGEVSADQLRSLYCDFVIVGHSERRIYFKETDVQLAAKIKLVLDAGMHPIFCVGEHLEERESNKHFDTVHAQLIGVLSQFDAKQLQKFIIAYEPVWAIGTGVTASTDQAQEMHAFIRRTLHDFIGADIAESTTLLYGGSCNASNAKDLFACKDVDGGLIGGASLKSEEFCQIINSF